MTYGYQAGRIEKQVKIVKFINTGLVAIMIAIAVTALAGSLYLAFTPRPVQTFITYENVTYQCTHYPDSMECHSINDPDVRFGRGLP